SRAIVQCNRFPRLRKYCAQVAETKVARFRDQDYWGKPVPGFGDPMARVLIVGLAPAAHGANRTGRMFTGDSSGDWLYEALHRFGFANQPTSTARSDGLALTDCWISASARCAPPDNKPLPEELLNCRDFLVEELALLKEVAVVIALGSIAHDSYLKTSGWWGHYSAGSRPRFGHAVETGLPTGQRLLASYHPSRQNTNTGRLTRPMWHAIFERARAIVDESGDKPTAAITRRRPE
ncbi:MAG: uracil-DNA glycosylase, partial [Gemmatimonadales bacterium]